MLDMLYIISIQFYVAFLKLFLLNYFQNLSNAKYIKDIDKILCRINLQYVSVFNCV